MIRLFNMMLSLLCVVMSLLRPANAMAQLLSDADLMTPADTSAPAVPEAVRDWVRQHHHPLRSLTADAFGDLAFLKPLLEGKRIVQLGENGHGMAEYSLAKVRLIKFLHQELGFEVIAFESALYQCYRAWQNAPRAAPAQTLRGCAYGVWHTAEVLPLFEYLHATLDTARPLHLAGFDIQPIGSNKADRPAFLRDIVARIDPAYARSVFALDTDFLKVYALGPRKRRAAWQEGGEGVIAAYDSLVAFLDANDVRLGRRDEVRVARQTAWSMAQYVRQQTALPDMERFAETRDAGMAENVEFILNELFPGKKVIIWGHNYHIRHANESIPPNREVYPYVRARGMGSWLARWHRHELYTVGLYCYRGQAADNSRTIFSIAPAEPGSLESILYQVRKKYVFVDLSQAGLHPETRWLFEPLTASFNGTDPMPMILKDQYDALLFIDTVTPPVFLY